MVYVSKEETITKKSVVANPDARKSFSEHYKAAQDLCQSQAIFMQTTREMETAINDENICVMVVGSAMTFLHWSDRCIGSRGPLGPGYDLISAAVCQLWAGKAIVGGTCQQRLPRM